MFVVTQISTNVQQTTEVVVLKLTAETPWAASRVPVYLDTPEMDSPVQVIMNINKYQWAVDLLLIS